MIDSEGLRSAAGMSFSDPYGVPTGYVPSAAAVIVSPISQREAVDTLVALAAAVDPVAKAVDDYLLMERKARAWDELRLAATCGVDEGSEVTAAEVLAFMDRLVHPAQDDKA